MNLNNFHCDRFEMCRVCLTEPESHVKYINIFGLIKQEEFVIQDQMLALLGIHVDPDDIRPKIICENCHGSLFAWFVMKKKAKDADIIVNYIAKKKFNYAKPGTSGASGIPETSNSSRMVRNNDESTQESLNDSQSRTIVTNLNGYSNCSYEQGTFSRSLVPSYSEPASSDNESDCLEVIVPVETIVLTSDEEDSESVAIEEKIKLSDSKDDAKISKIVNLNDGTENMYYCSKCQMKNILDHDCSLFSKSFFTCLVPNCNILSRTLQDFIPHYQLHIGMASSAVLCRRCYQEADGSNLDVNGCHIMCHAVNAFKCHPCNVIFNSMQAFSFHKLKTHNGRLMDGFGNYLCLHCEESSPELMNIISHTKHCLKNQELNVTANSTKPDKTKNAMVCKNKKKKILQTSKLALFTCLKPTCNLAFQSYSVFKFHYRQHFELGNKLVCWQCCESFSDISGLRAHQIKNNCRIQGMFKCYECPKKFDDLEGLSIHKLAIHDGKLILTKNNNNKAIMCELCRLRINVNKLNSHLVTCQKNNNKKNEPTSTCTKYESTYACETCDKVYPSTKSLSNHRRIHTPSRISKNLKKEQSNKPIIKLTKN